MSLLGYQLHHLPHFNLCTISGAVGTVINLHALPRPRSMAMSVAMSVAM